jgi:hypothetical protein
MVNMKNLWDSSRQGTGYVLVQVVDTYQPIIAIG